MKIDIKTSRMMGFADFLQSAVFDNFRQAYSQDPNIRKNGPVIAAAFQELQPLLQQDSTSQTGELFTSLALKAATGELKSDNIDAFCDEMAKGLPNGMTAEQRVAIHTLYDAYSDFFDAHLNQMNLEATALQNEAEDSFPDSMTEVADFLGYDIPEDYELSSVVIPSPKGLGAHGRSVENEDGSRTQYAAIPVDSRDEIDNTLITIFHEDVHKMVYDCGAYEKVGQELSSEQKAGQVTSDFNLWNEAVAVLFQNKYCDKLGIERRPYAEIDGSEKSKAFDSEASRLEGLVDKGEKLFGEDGKLSPGIKAPEKNINPILSQKLQEGLTK